MDAIICQVKQIETEICGDAWQPGARTATAMQSAIKLLDSVILF